MVFLQVEASELTGVEATVRDIALQAKDSKPEADAIRDFIKFFKDCCFKKPDLFVASENPVRDIAFIDCELTPSSCVNYSSTLCHKILQSITG
jgi:hypothetical protein